MVLPIDTNTADGPRHPTVGERLRPIRIDEKARHVAFRRPGGNTEFDRGLRRNSEQARKHVVPDSHELLLPNSDGRRDYQRQELGSIGPFPPPGADLRSPDPEHLHLTTGTEIYATKAFSDHTGLHRHYKRSEAT